MPGSGTARRGVRAALLVRRELVANRERIEKTASRIPYFNGLA